MKTRYIYYYNQDTENTPFKSVATLCKHFGITPQKSITPSGQSYYYWIDSFIYCTNKAGDAAGYIERDEVAVCN